MSLLYGRIEPILEFEGGPQPLWYMCRHFVSEEAFCEALFHDFEIVAKPENVEKCYARCVPSDDKSSLLFYQKAGRGAFAVTFVDLAKTDKL